LLRIIQVKEAVDKEWDMFKDERTAGVEEINRLRQRAIEEEAQVKSERVMMETDPEGQLPSVVEEKLPSPPIEEVQALTRQPLGKRKSLVLTFLRRRRKLYPITLMMMKPLNTK